ncbi:MAG: cupin domain-containing protein [Planctomycetota bacterium]|jgi:quercetin dioxygenase-like cupin family protein
MSTTGDHQEIQRVPKVWGEEHWIVNREYCGKKLVLKKGYRCSLHYHKVKDEVFYLISGRVLIEVGEEERVLEKGDHQHIPPGTVHRFWGLEDSEIVEFSTHHDDADSYRLSESGAFDASALAGRNLV